MLTKEQKLEAYTYAYLCALEISTEPLQYLYDYSDSVSFGVCDNLGMFKNGTFQYPDDLLLEFPEFLIQKPKGAGVFYWWQKPSENIKSHNERIKAIERAIELTEKL